MKTEDELKLKVNIAKANFVAAEMEIVDRRRSSVPNRKPSKPSKYEIIDLKILARDAATKAREVFIAKKAEVLINCNGDLSQVPTEDRVELHRLLKEAYDMQFNRVQLGESYREEGQLLESYMISEIAYKKYAEGNNEANLLTSLAANDTRVSEATARDDDKFQEHIAQYSTAKRAWAERYELLEKARSNAWKIKGRKVDPSPLIYEGSKEFRLLHSRNDTAKTGYAGVAYINENANGKEIIIGSPHLAKFNDMRSVTALYHGSVPNQFEQSLKPFLDEIMENLKGEDHKKIKITLTGFSLGAVLSDLGAAYLHEHGFNVSTFGIDNPGTGKLCDKVRKQTRKEMLAQKQPLTVTKTSQPDIHNYITSKQTIANSIHPQVGTVHVFSDAERPAELDKHQRPDRIFKLRHLMNLKSGLQIHSEANYNLKQDSTAISVINQPESKNNKSFPVLRAATTFLAVPVMLPLLVVSAPLVCAYKGVKKMAKAVEKHRHKDEQAKTPGTHSKMSK